MGCGGSKVDDLGLVTLCRERKEFVKAASNYRYILAAAHVSYFTSLKDVGDALISFVDEEILIGVSSAPPDSPVLTLPSVEGKKTKSNHKSSSSSSSISHSPSIPLVDPDEDEQDKGSHLHLSSDSDSDSNSSPGHIHTKEESSTVDEIPYYPPPHNPPYNNPSYNPPYNNPSYNPPYIPPYNPSYGPPHNPAYIPSYNPSYNPPPYDPYQHPSSRGAPGVNYNAYYMRKAPTRPTAVYEDPQAASSTGYWQDSSNVYPSYQQYPDGDFFGFPMGSAAPQEPDDVKSQSRPAPTPAPPEASSWDFLNIFGTWEHTIPGYYSRNRYGSISSSPDSKEIREREGIPDLEEETESEIKEVKRGKNVREQVKSNFGIGASGAVPYQENDTMSSSGPSQYDEGSKWTMPSPNNHKGSSRRRPQIHEEGPSELLKSHYIDEIRPVIEKEIKIGSDAGPSKNTEEVYSRKREVNFDVNDSSGMPNSLSALSTHGTRDLQEAVKEIRDEFQTASDYGKEVALLLEVRKLPYQSRRAMLKLLLSRILYSIAPSRSSSASASEQLIQLASRTREIAKAYCGDLGKDANKKNINSINISSVLDELYAWEKKLYKEVKDEERLRIIYEKESKKLKLLADQGAESNKIDATLASIKRLLTKINLHVRTIEAISRRINILRDDELQPQLKILMDGLVRMWRSTLTCHQKQFQAIQDTKRQMLKAKTGLRKDSSLRATVKLEMELLNWSTHFSSWINAQKSYVTSLNGWLLKSLSHEQEETADGPVPFSPGRIGAPPIFVACNDWFQAVERISESGVTNSINDFALNLHQLWEKEDEERRQRIRSDYVIKDFERRVKTYRMQRENLKREQDELSEIATGSGVHSGSGVSAVETLKVDLDTMRKRLVEERARQKEVMKQASNAAVNSIQAGLVPIFQSLGNFTSKALKAHEHVRTEYVDNL